MGVIFDTNCDIVYFNNNGRVFSASCCCTIKNGGNKSKRLYRICDSCGLQKKSTHKIRKTFCSIILDAGFDKNLVISLMGHTDINTSENYYHFDRKSSAEKQRRVDNLLDFKLDRAL